MADATHMRADEIQASAGFLARLTLRAARAEPGVPRGNDSAVALRRIVLAPGTASEGLAPKGAASAISLPLLANHHR